MAKTKKATTKSTPKIAPKKAINPLDAPRIKLPEDDLIPVAQPTISSIMGAKISKAFGVLSRHKVKVFLAIVIVVAACFGVSNYISTRDQLNQLANPKTSTQTEITIITDQVKDTVELPTGETPTIATVSDVDKLKSQNFFKSAENGDKVLIYAKAGKALLYRYTSKKVIEFSNVSLGGQQNQSSQTNTQPSQTQTQPQTQQPASTQSTPAISQPSSPQN